MIFARQCAIQAEVGCVVCKSYAIVLGLASDAASGFTRMGGLECVGGRPSGNAMAGDACESDGADGCGLREAV